MHESALIFVPAATFGQLIPKLDLSEAIFYEGAHARGVCCQS